MGKEKRMKIKFASSDFIRTANNNISMSVRNVCLSSIIILSTEEEKKEKKTKPLHFPFNYIKTWSLLFYFIFYLWIVTDVGKVFERKLFKSLL